VTWRCCGIILGGKRRLEGLQKGMCQRPKFYYFRLHSNFCYIISRSGWLTKAVGMSALQEDPELYQTVELEISVLG